jgi:hypothetical protein
VLVLHLEHAADTTNKSLRPWTISGDSNETLDQDCIRRVPFSSCRALHATQGLQSAFLNQPGPGTIAQPSIILAQCHASCKFLRRSLVARSKSVNQSDSRIWLIIVPRPIHSLNLPETAKNCMTANRSWRSLYPLLVGVLRVNAATTSLVC